MKRPQWSIIILLALAAAAAAGLIPPARRSVLAGGRESIRETVLRSAAECYAVEGAYPESLEYLIENYGLSVNNSRYIVVYNAFASNQLPDVQVLVRGEYVR